MIKQLGTILMTFFAMIASADPLYSPQFPTQHQQIRVTLASMFPCDYTAVTVVAGTTIQTTLYYTECSYPYIEPPFTFVIGPFPPGTYEHVIRLNGDPEPGLIAMTTLVVAAGPPLSIPALSTSFLIALVAALALAAVLAIRRAV